MPVRFGILSTGTIAHKMARTLPMVPDAQLLAVGSRTQAKADAFAAEFGIPRAYGSTEALLSDPDIDAVYVASPHPQHKPMTLAAIAAGKHVLCEKPLTLTRADSEAVYAAARGKGVFLMEAMWTRFLPTILAAKRWIAEGRIGELRMMTAAFGYDTPLTEPLDRILLASEAGGALYDVGIYAVEAALDFFAPQRVTEVQGMAALTPWGADGVNAGLLRFKGGGIACFQSAVCCELRNDATLYGSKGYIRLFPEFYAPETAELWIGGKREACVGIRIESGFEYEVQHMIDCIRAGKPCSDRIPPADTYACGDIFETLMRQGFRA